MWLRATAGAYAGQIRDYAYTAGVAALATGSAVRVDTPGVCVRHPGAHAVSDTTLPSATMPVAVSRVTGPVAGRRARKE